MISLIARFLEQLGNLIFRSKTGDDLIELFRHDVTGLVEVLKEPGGCEVQIGVRGIRGSDMVARALANEFGTRKIPERSFLRATVDRNRIRYAMMLKDALELGLAGQDLVLEMEKIGQVIVGDVQQYMTELRHPPNAPSTIARKGSDNPLIDTGQLRASIDYVVLCEGEPVSKSHSLRTLGKALRDRMEVPYGAAG